MKVISIEQKMVSVSEAEGYLSYTDFGQRSIDKYRIDRYAAMMSADQWRGGDGMIVIGVIRDTFYLVAGQHRLRAIVQAGIPVPLTVTLREYDGMEDLKVDYTTTNQGKALTRKQGLHALDTAQIIAVGEKDIQAVSAALNLIAQDFGRDRRVADELADLKATHDVIVYWETPIRAFCHAANSAYGPERHWFFRAGVIAVGIINFRFCPEQAQAFWSSVAENDALSKTSPQAVLRRFISTNNAQAMHQSEYARVVAHAWNAFVEGRELNAHGNKTGDLIVIKGSPYRRVDKASYQKGIGLTILGLVK